MLKTVIIEENRLNRKKLAEQLSMYCQIELLFSVDTLQSFQVAMLTTSAHPPDLVMIRTSDNSIISEEISRQIKEHCPGCIIIQYGLHQDGESLLIHLGKQSSSADQESVTIDLLRSLLHELCVKHEPQFTVSSRSSKINVQAIKNKVTPREMEVIEGLSCGLTYAEIAVKMFISINTIRNYVKNIYDKLEVNNKVQLAQKYYGVIDSSVGSSTI